MTDVKAALNDHLRNMAAPFLFVGAGFSRRYLGAEDWEGLLRHFAQLTSKPYDYYRASAGGDLPTVASALVKEFHEIWWSDPQFQASRDAWAGEIRTPASALKVEIARHLGDSLSRLPSKGPLSKELELLQAAVVDGIITTNFDPLLEALFPDFRVFVGQDELLFSNPQGIGEIYKIHGSCAQPDSLVLTAEDYRHFEQRNAYLAAKLLTIFVEHPVIFLGYSLQDKNVVSILRSIASCLTQSNIDELRDRLIFVQWQPDGFPSVGPYSIVIDDFVLTVLRIVVADFSQVFAALAALQRSFPAKLLRRLKEHVYELVLTDNPHSRLAVRDIDDDTNNADIDVVFGVGVQAQLGHHGYVGLDRWNIVDDVIAGGTRYDASSIVTETAPRLMAGNANLPVFKYLREAGMLTQRGAIRQGVSVPPKVAAMVETASTGGLKSSQWYANKAPTVLAGIRTIAQLQEQQGLDGVLNYGLHLQPTAALADELGTFLDDHRDLRTGTTRPTQYVKLTCFFDWLKYGRR
jgi:hypothetical protein